MSEAKFTPVRGLEVEIMDLPYRDGAIYFATDTKQIYMDARGQSKIPMGGGGGSSTGSGIIFGERPTTIEDEEATVFTFTLSQLSINYLPGVDAVILNTVDGCFYRVIEVVSDDNIKTSRLTVAGGGGGGQQENPVNLTLDVISGIATGQTFVYGQSSNIIFRGNVDNGDAKVIYQIVVTNTYAGATTSKTYGAFTADVDTNYTFDLGSVLQLGTNSVKITVSSDNANKTVSKSFSLINCVEMELEASENFNPLNFFKGAFNFYCIASGADLTKKIEIYVDDALIPSLTENEITVARREVQFSIPPQSHGVHTIKAVMTCAESAATQSLSYNVCCIEDGVDASVIWYNQKSAPESIIDHDILSIEYMVYNPTQTTDIEMHYYINGAEIATSPLNVNYTPTSWLKWRVTGYTVGENTLSLRTGTTTVTIPISVQKDTKRNLDLVTAGLHVNLKAEGRSNFENPQSRSTWQNTSLYNGDVTSVIFNDFNWYNNGWMTEDDRTFLRISNGASIEIPFTVLNSKSLSESVGFELMFKIRNIRNYSTLIKTEVEDPESETPTIVKTVSSTDGVWGSYYNNNIGFCLGTQEAFFKTRDQLVSGRYKENEIVHVTFVVEATGKIYIYINGINSGIAKYNVNTDSLASGCQKLKINSEYCDIDLYNLRVYRTNLTPQYVVQNYLADYNDADLYDMNTDIVDYNNGIPSINYINMVEYNAKHPEALLQPYMIIETTDANDELPYYKKEVPDTDSNWLVNIEFVNPTLDYKFENNLFTQKDLEDRGYSSVEQLYINSCPSYKATNVDFNVQGTSSQGYPIRNYKAKFKNAKTWTYSKLFDADNKPINILKGGTTAAGTKVGKKWHMDSFIGENKTTLKADYMDSSGVHNTGFANLVYTMYTKHPLNDYSNLPDDCDTTRLRTNVYGFPILMFHKDHLGNYKFLGKYNYNLDKGCDDTYGFCDWGDDSYVDVTSLVNTENFNASKLYIQEGDEFVKLPEGATYDSGATYYRLDETADSNALNPDYDPTDPYSRQYLPWSAAAECWEFQQNQGGRCSFAKADFEELAADGTLTVMQDYEYRYHADSDSIDNAVAGVGEKYKSKGQVFQSQAEINAFMLKKLSRFEKLVNWLVSTDATQATNEPLESPVTYGETQYTIDNSDYRLAKFSYEFEDHLDKEYCLIYWIMTELLLCYDSRGKNLMMATWGPHQKGGNDIWYPIFYDIDTQLGVNNSGVPYWDYYEEASNNGTFSTPDNILWVNMQKCFASEIRNKYDALAGTKLTAQRLTDYYNFDPKVTLSVAMEGNRPMIIQNVDEYQKYIAPSITGYINTSGTRSYTDYFFYCLQGTRELQRALFLRNRFNYIDSMWQAGTYSKTQAKQGIQTRFDANDGVNTSDKYLNTQPTQEEIELGYQYAEYGTQPLDFVLDYEITPFLKQYISYYYDDTKSDAVYASDGETVTVPMLESKREELLNKKQKTQQLVYWGGGEYISSLGDLSKKYLDQLTISTASRLTDLIVGSEEPGYFNNMLNSQSFSPDDGATKEDDNGNVIPNPLAKTLLKKVVLSNLGKLDGTLDFSGSEKLKELRALNTKVSSFIFADGVQIEKLYLPKTVTNLILKEPTSLIGILTGVNPEVETVEEYETITVSEEQYNNFLEHANDDGYDGEIYYQNTIDGYKRCDDTDYFKVTYDEDGNIMVDETAYDKSRNYYVLRVESETIYPDGLYIAGLTDLANIAADSTIALNTLDIIGGNMGYDSYTLLNKAAQIKKNMIANTRLDDSYDRHLYVNLENVEWTPYRQMEEGEIALPDGVYYLLNDHDELKPYNKVSNEYPQWTLNVLNGKVFEYQASKFNGHESDIISLDMFDEFINDYQEAKDVYDELVSKDSFAIDDYNFFKSNDIYAQGPTLAKITGDIFINNPASAPIDEAELKNYYHDKYYSKLNFHVANISKAKVVKFVEIVNEDTMQETVWDTLKYSANGSVTYPELTTVVGSKLNYDFQGWSTQFYPQAELDAMEPSDVQALLLDENSIKNVKFADAVDNVIKLYAVYTVHSYHISFLYKDGTEIETIRVPSNSYIPVPSVVPYKDDSDLEFDQTWKFVGYARNPEAYESEVIGYKDTTKTYLKLLSTSDLTLYAIFTDNPISVYSNIHPEYFSASNADYFDAYDDNYSLLGGYELTLISQVKGKITVPAEFTKDGVTKPVVAINASFSSAGGGSGITANGKLLTHVFFEKNEDGTANIRQFKEKSFYGSTKSAEKILQYVEFPIGLRLIDTNCFSQCGNFRNTEITGTIVNISNYAFTKTYENYYSASNPATLKIGSMVQRIGDSAFSSIGNNCITTMEIGDSDNKSELTIPENVTSGRSPIAIVGLSNIDFYTNKYTSADVLNYVGSGKFFNVTATINIL